MEDGALFAQPPLIVRTRTDRGRWRSPPWRRTWPRPSAVERAELSYPAVRPMTHLSEAHVHDTVSPAGFDPGHPRPTDNGTGRCLSIHRELPL